MKKAGLLHRVKADAAVFLSARIKVSAMARMNCVTPQKVLYYPYSIMQNTQEIRRYRYVT